MRLLQYKNGKPRAVASKIPEGDPVNGDVTPGGPKFDPPAQQLLAASLQIFEFFQNTYSSLRDHFPGVQNIASKFPAGPHSPFVRSVEKDDLYKVHWTVLICQDWGVLTKSRAELGIAPPPAPSPCLAIDMQCKECAGTKCSVCLYPFIVDTDGSKCVCPKGLTLSNDTTTCIDMGIVDIGKKALNDPLLNKGINQTETGIEKLQKQFLAVATNGIRSFLAKEQKDISLAANAALAPLGLLVAPGPAAGPLAAAGAPEAQPGSAVAAQPSIEYPSAQGPTGDLALAPAGAIPQQAPAVSLQQVGGAKATTGSLADLGAVISQAASAVNLKSLAAGTLPNLFTGVGRRMLRAD
ncbi:hypothetical protein COCOBI_12-1190 [Coccomyxa sp. Obi]|nr:hypothetical protein COCOBI_12-1190 [Coccomyxa sp. Obi]